MARSLRPSRHIQRRNSKQRTQHTQQKLQNLSRNMHTHPINVDPDTNPNSPTEPTALL